MLDEILIFSALGVIAGLLAGMFGIGGGLITDISVSIWLLWF